MSDEKFVKMLKCTGQQTVRRDGKEVKSERVFFQVFELDGEEDSYIFKKEEDLLASYKVCESQPANFGKYIKMVEK